MSNRAAVLDELFGTLSSSVESVFSLMEIAEDEITAAQKRHGEQPPVRDASGKVTRSGPIWNSFGLLRPTGPMADRAPFVYESHCRELLDRVARGQDTRLPTDAEMVLSLSETSQLAPLHGAAAGLYLRLFHRAFPDHAHDVSGEVTVADYERMYGNRLDDQEAFLLRQLRQPWREAATTTIGTAA
ncbi:hypothetical protein [Actinocorallia sp. A-T 12471]|uniref:hypothetical protein n=1 Tax=Actinocorallia sp. A-T 12471 TaxID=3089813 RepID=UPI0029CFADF0|nr:hypothetical protein [Actinocorallia sp. A-T 12471]MDX6740449.1 hypothetical protein [Actinocorallia sp. A-T 12471]